MSRLAAAAILINIIGLAASQGLESWRWGTISSTIPLSAIWPVSLVLIWLAVILGRTTDNR